LLHITCLLLPLAAIGCGEDTAVEGAQTPADTGQANTSDDA